MEKPYAGRDIRQYMIEDQELQPYGDWSDRYACIIDALN